MEDVFLVNYSQKDTNFWDKLWVACQGQLGLWHLASGSDILVVDKSGHALLTVDQGKSFSMRKQGHEEVDSENVDTHKHEQNPRSSQCHKPSQYHNAASSSSTLPQCQGPKKEKSHVVDEDGSKSSQCHKAPHHHNAASSSTFPQSQGQKKGKSHAVDEHGGKSSQYCQPPHHHNAPSSSSTFPQCQGQKKGKSHAVVEHGGKSSQYHQPPLITMPYLHHLLSHNAKVRMLRSLKSFLLMRLVV